MSELKIRSEGMLATQHSWAVTMRNLLLQFQEQKHKLYLISSNGNSLIPKTLLIRLNRIVKVPDLDICYTMPKNFEIRFEKKSKLKMAIYNYETSKLPAIWFDKIKYVDYILPSSNFSKQIFIEAGWPESKCKVIPHGITLSDYLNKEKYSLHTSKRFKFLNISIPHKRKNIDLLVDAYYSSFSGQDDVCLILKTNLDVPKYKFEVNVKQILLQQQKKHAHKLGGLPQIELVIDKLDNMVPLYNSCDAIVSATSAEGFGLPFLEGLAAKKIVIAPRCSGHLDFLNDTNSLLVDVKTIDAELDMQYWIPTVGAKTYLPNLDSLSSQMINAYKNSDKLNDEFSLNSQQTVEKYTWQQAANKILALV